MQVYRDLDVDAMYARVADLPVARTDEIDDRTLVDLDANGVVIGVEVLQPDRAWPLNDILTRYSVTAGDAHKLRALLPKM